MKTSEEEKLLYIFTSLVKFPNSEGIGPVN